MEAPETGGTKAHITLHPPHIAYHIAPTAYHLIFHDYTLFTQILTISSEKIDFSWIFNAICGHYTHFSLQGSTYHHISPMKNTSRQKPMVVSCLGVKWENFYYCENYFGVTLKLAIFRLDSARRKHISPHITHEKYSQVKTDGCFMFRGLSGRTFITVKTISE